MDQRQPALYIVATTTAQWTGLLTKMPVDWTPTAPSPKLTRGRQDNGGALALRKRAVYIPNHGVGLKRQPSFSLGGCGFVCVRACVRASVRARVRACVHVCACVRANARVLVVVVFVCVCVFVFLALGICVLQDCFRHHTEEEHCGKIRARYFRRAELISPVVSDLLAASCPNRMKN